MSKISIKKFSTGVLSMKKLIFGLLVLVGGVLFLTSHLAQIATESTDKLSINVLSKLIATTDNQPVQNPPVTNAKPAENKPTIAEQAVIPLVKQVTDNALEPLKQQLTEQTKQIDNPIQKPKTPIATIKIYDKKPIKKSS
jgi:hypothetical protein